MPRPRTPATYGGVGPCPDETPVQHGAQHSSIGDFGSKLGSSLMRWIYGAESTGIRFSRLSLVRVGMVGLPGFEPGTS